VTLSEILRVEREVEIFGNRTVEDAERALNAVANGSAHPVFRGSITGGSGILRMRGLTHMGARSLKLTLLPTETGCVLRGMLQPVLFLRIYRWLGIVAMVIFGLTLLLQIFRHQVPLWAGLVQLVANTCFIAVFIDGYLWLTVGFTRRIERTLLKTVEYVIRDDASAAVVVDLLSSSR
jgi:hypothetical protein